MRCHRNNPHSSSKLSSRRKVSATINTANKPIHATLAILVFRFSFVLFFFYYFVRWRCMRTLSSQLFQCALSKILSHKQNQNCLALTGYFWWWFISNENKQKNSFSCLCACASVCAAMMSFDCSKWTRQKFNRYG